MRSSAKLLDYYGFSPESHFIIEGRIAIAAAMAQQWPIDKILLSSDTDSFELEADLVERTDKHRLSELLGFKFHRGQIAIAQRSTSKLPTKFGLSRPLRLVALNNLADPGNIGTIIRNSAAFGIDAVICDQNGADPFNAKSVRASATTIFSIPVFTIELDSWLPPDGYEKIATCLDGDSVSLPNWTPPKSQGLVIYFGSEAAGLNRKIQENCDTHLKIPNRPEAESLNVASSSAIILYHLQQCMEGQQ